MDKEGYILRKEKGSGLYEKLHQEALEMLQKLSGKIWTDYNEHDPGVTLLENLAYTITELSYKSQLPIKDLLMPKEGEVLTSGFNALYTASDILTTGPITFNDYRKIVIDSIKNVKNAWIYPVSDSKDTIDNIKGLFHVYIEKQIYWADKDKESTDNARIIQEVRVNCHRHRNLCEDIYRLKIFEPFPFTMEFKIMLSDKVDGEEVLAQILYKINNYLAPEVKYHSLWDLQENKTPINEIFNGPSLPNGFIIDEDLKDPVTDLSVPEIVALISRIPGVLGIPQFYLKYQDAMTKVEHRIDDFFNIPKYKIGRLGFPAQNGGLIFENSGIQFNPDLAETKKQLSFIQGLDYGNFRRASSAMNTIPIPAGVYQDMSFYHPLRKQFPELYGIGDRGISTAATGLRKAQIKQLKAYLMPFDQLMVNFLTQLEHIHTLYNIDFTAGASYFTQDLPDITELKELTKPDDCHEDFKKCREVIFKRLNDEYDVHVLKRFNAIADHLLARFNETFQTYSLRKINSIGYGESLTSKRLEKELLKEKRKLLQDYGKISYNRAKSFDYHQLNLMPSGEYLQESNTDFIPGAIYKIALLLGIRNFRIRPLTKGVVDASLEIQPRSKTVKVIIGEIDIDTPEGHTTFIALEKRKMETTAAKDLWKVMHYVGDESTILEEVLKKGVLRENYSIEKSTSSKALYHVMYKRTDKKSNIAHITKTQEAAVTAIDKAINYLVAIDEKSEGFFVIEHLILLPPYGKDFFGFCIDFAQLIPGIDLKVKHAKLKSCKKRNDVIKNLTELLYADDLDLCIEKKKDGFEIRFNTLQEEHSFVVENRYGSKQKAEQQIGLLATNIKNISRERLGESIQCTVHYGANCVNEKFFSLRMSFVIPSWPVRFQSKNFRKMFENTAYEEIPIHIGTSFFWLDVKKLQKFETCYFEWLKLLKQKGTVAKRITTAYKLILMLQEWSKKSAEN